MPEREVTQADIFEQLHRMADVGQGGEELDRFIDLHVQHIANVFAASGDSQRLGVKARATAGFAQYFHVRQKAHGDGANALAFAMPTVRSCLAMPVHYPRKGDRPDVQTSTDSHSGDDL